jgi:predicted CxxxxCH...CXXCH cytochrome family protein
VEDATLLPSKYTNYSVGNLGSSSTYRFGCASCHNPAQASHVNGYASGSYRAQVFFGYTTPGKKPTYTYTGTAGTADNGFGWSNGNAACNSTYCHSNGAGGTGAAVSWATTVNSAANVRCKTCHNYTTGSGSAMATGTHGKHIGGATYNFSCRKCHVVTTSDGTSITDKTRHVGKSVNVAFSNTTTAVNGSYNGVASPMAKSPGSTYGSCANTYCHSLGTSTTPSVAPPNVIPTWGGTLNNSCSGCHGNDNSAAFKIGTVGSAAHAKHVQAYGYGCVKCHSATVSDNRTISNYANHVTRLVNVAFNNTTTAINGTYNGLATPMTKLPGSATGACSNTYCHSLGNTSVTNVPPLPAEYGGSIFAVPNWSDVGAIGCNGCHGRSTDNGMPDYTNGGAGAATANSHLKHITLGAISCGECHSRTTKDGVSIRSIIPSTHVNHEASNIFFNLSGSNKLGVYTPASKGCNTIVCHSNGRGTYQPTPPRWGESDNCSYCHPISSLGGSHAKHIDTLQTVQFYTYTANRSTSAAYNFGCSSCHPLVSTTNHAKGTIMLDFRKTVAGVGTIRSKNSAAITASGPAGTPNAGTTADSVTNSVVKCINIYCHSNGYSANPVYATTPNWYGGSFSGDKCANCHGNSPNSTIAGSSAHYSNNLLGQGVSGGHVVGIHYDTIFTGTAGLATAGTGNASGHGNAGTATTINCNICHNATVTSANNDKNVICATCHNGTQATLRGNAAIFDKSKHVNGVIEVVFSPINVLSKAQMLNSAVISPYSSIWTRNVGYKAGGVFDRAKAALDTASMWDGTTKGCSNISCHNGQPVKWGSTNGSTTCQRCHPNM